MNKRKMIRTALCAFMAATVAVTGLPTAFGVDGRAAENGLWAEYYSGTNFERFVSGGRETTVDHVWENGRLPAGLSSVEFFSARWVGELLAEEAGDYTLYTNVDDGAKLYVDGELVINDAGPHFPAENAAEFRWEAGSRHEIEIAYYNGELGGTMQLLWETPSGQKTVIPAENLFLIDRPDTDWTITGDTIAARAHIYREDQTAYRLVMEGYDQDGELVETLTADRPSDDANLWTTGGMTYAPGMSYRAYMTDGAGEVVSEQAEKMYGADGVLEVDAEEVTGRVSPYLNGAGIEDVNHELYGGIWSQMVYGESFAEPAGLDMEGFVSAGGEWTTQETEDGRVLAVEKQDDGPKMVLTDTECESGAFSADVYFEGGGPVGFIVKVRDAKPGADSFYGYEVGLMNGTVRIARHENNFDGMRDIPCAASRPGQWINLKVETTRDNIAVYVDGEKVCDYPTVSTVTAGAMGLRAWDGAGKFKNFRFQESGGAVQEIPVPEIAGTVSGMWQSVERGSAQGQFSLDANAPYTKNLTGAGAQSQKITFVSGEGAVGVNNMGLNRKGMNFEADKEYEGYFYARSEEGAKAYVVLESADGSKQYAETAAIEVEAGNGWKKYAFTITPNAKDAAGRMTIELREAGTVDLGYVFLQPGEWGRYKGLPVRKDVGEALEKQNLSLLRFGGSMINVADYKWKNMLGAPEDRPTYTGCWYGYSSFGFGIVEFLNLCEALGIMGIPTLNSYETAQDMADFIDFATGTDESNQWVQKRIEMGHPEPYDLPYLQLGNEETVDDVYAARFNGLAEAVWEKDADIILVAADLVYFDVIKDPDNITGAASGITNMDGHKAIMEFARSHGRTVYFDVHIWTHGPGSSADYTKVLLSYYDALHKVCPGTDAKVVIFEYNALAHTLERGLGNAYSTIDMEKYSDKFPIACSANCLQVDGHNDNGWDQGLVFMNNDSVWYQPPAYVTQMSGGAYQPNLVAAEMTGDADGVNYVATRSDDGNTLTLKFLNQNAVQVGISAQLQNFAAGGYTVTQTVLTGENLTDTNTAETPEGVRPETQTLETGVENGKLLVMLPAWSYTVVEITKNGEIGPETPGDLDEDGEVTIADVMEACKVMARESAGTDPTDDEIKRGDLDGDGEITIADVMEICKILARQG